RATAPLGRARALRPLRRGADELAGGARPRRLQGALAALCEPPRPLPALPGRGGHDRVRLPGERRAVGPVVPARGAAADQAPERPAALPPGARAGRLG